MEVGCLGGLKLVFRQGYYCSSVTHNRMTKSPAASHGRRNLAPSAYRARKVPDSGDSPASGGWPNPAPSSSGPIIESVLHHISVA